MIRLTLFGLLLIFFSSCKSVPTSSNTSLQILSNESFQKQIKRKDVYVHQQNQTFLIKDAYIFQDTLYVLEERTLTTEEATIVKNPVKSQDRYKHRSDVNIYVHDSLDISSPEKTIPLMSVKSIQNNKNKENTTGASDDSIGIFILVFTLLVVIVAILLGLLLLMAIFSSFFSGGW